MANLDLTSLTYYGKKKKMFSTKIAKQAMMFVLSNSIVFY